MTKYRKFSWGTKTFVMGIINATPDSFSGDGTALDLNASLLKAKEFKLDTPVMAAINNLVVGKVSLSVAIQSLLSRPPKKE